MNLDSRFTAFGKLQPYTCWPFHLHCWIATFSIFQPTVKLAPDRRTLSSSNRHSCRQSSCRKTCKRHRRLFIYRSRSALLTTLDLSHFDRPSYFPRRVGSRLRCNNKPTTWRHNPLSGACKYRAQSVQLQSRWTSFVCMSRAGRP